MVKKPLDKRKREWSTVTNVNTEEKKKDNKEKRKKLCLLMGLPDDMTPNALLAAINLLYGKKKYEVLISEFDRDS